MVSLYHGLSFKEKCPTKLFYKQNSGVLQKMVKDNSVLYGILAGLGLLIFYISVVSFFQGFGFAILNFKSLWYWIVPLVIGVAILVPLASKYASPSQVE